MNGPEHYRESERLLQLLATSRANIDGQMVVPEQALQLQASFQVTATVALAHATLARAALGDPS